MSTRRAVALLACLLPVVAVSWQNKTRVLSAPGQPLSAVLAARASELRALEQTCDYHLYFLKERSRVSQCKGDPEAHRRDPECRRTLFVTGCAGAGTHYVKRYVERMKFLEGIKHEEPNVKPDGLVSWAARRPRELALPQAQYATYKLGEQVLHKAMTKWASNQVNPPCTYAHVMHVVRHPLKLLASSIDFGQCVECWAHIEDNSVPSLGSLAAPMRAALLRNRRARAGGKMGGRDWAEEAIDELLRGFMLYYVTWNPMIEGVAEYRFRIEDANYTRVCELAVPGHDCAGAIRRADANLPQAVSHGGSSLVVTWERLEGIDKDLADATWALAQRYGYERAPPSREVAKEKSKANPSRTRTR